MNKTRADILLVEQGLAKTREKAKSLIMAGEVYSMGKRIEKAGESVSRDQTLEVKENPLPFVSRGGLKLLKAIDEFSLDLQGVVALDIGASTGGFTDCMLQKGAAKVYAIDVGYGQLDWRLRNDKRVKVMERTNARFLKLDWLDERPSFASIDVSFISLTLILEPLFQCLIDGGTVVALVKPQFEAGRDKVGKHGVVRSIDTHVNVLENISAFALKTGYSVSGIGYSPITGPKGNIEFLLHLKKGKSSDNVMREELRKRIIETVEGAHSALN